MSARGFARLKKNAILTGQDICCSVPRIVCIAQDIIMQCSIAMSFPV